MTENIEEKELDGFDRWIAFYDKYGISYTIGYVYVLEAGNGLYKIGKTKNPQARLKALQSSSPLDLNIYRLFKCEEYHEAEKTLHELFEEKREHGEWFRLSLRDLRFIDRLGQDGAYYTCYV